MNEINCHQDTSSAAAVKADTFGLPDLGKTDPNQQPVEGWSATEETQRAKALWLELLEKPISQRKVGHGSGCWEELKMDIDGYDILSFDMHLMFQGLLLVVSFHICFNVVNVFSTARCSCPLDESEALSEETRE